MKKKVMVDLSATIIHHGHIRLLKKASKCGTVIVGLTKDKEIIKHKKYTPELKYEYRKEILNELKCVKKVVPSNFLITQKFLDKHKIDILVSGGDYRNRKFRTKTINFDRTKNISSTMIRKKATKIIKKY